MKKLIVSLLLCLPLLGMAAAPSVDVRARTSGQITVPLSVLKAGTNVRNGPGIYLTNASDGALIIAIYTGVTSLTNASVNVLISPPTGTTNDVIRLSVPDLDYPGTQKVLWGVKSNGWIGVNQSTPMAPIHVGNYLQNNSVDCQVLVSRDISNSSGSGNAHAFSDSSNIGRIGSIGYNSFDARCAIGGGVDYDHYAGFQALPVYANPGATMVSLYEAFLGATVSSGTLKSLYGVYIANPGGGGTINTNYGVFIEPLTVAGQNYPIFQKGAGTNYLGGKLGIGDRFPVSPLSVVGLPVYANNAAALAGSPALHAGDFYRTGGDPDLVCVVH